MSEAIIQALRRKYMENIGNPARQLIGGGVRGYLGLDQPEYADQLGREAYANAQALGNAPGVGAPSGAFKAMAAAPLMVKALRRAPRSEALEMARQNAVKMLGLPENNTAMDRSRALGFGDEVYHGTTRSFPAFDMNKLGASGVDAAEGVFTANSPKIANEFTWRNGSQEGANIMPLMLRTSDPIKSSTVLDGTTGSTAARILQQAKRAGYDRVDFPTNMLGAEGTTQVVFDPSRIRSRFAAFDPARVNENDLLGRADPRLLGLIAAGTATGATVAALRNKKEDEKRKKDKRSED